MRDIGTLSKIGFGTYRVSQKEPEYAEALRLFLSLGGNLIDTANSYQNGESERLIGSVIQAFQPDEVFIISKAGYVEKKFESKMSTAALQKTISVSDAYSHCIHPDFLEQKLEESLKRIRRSYIDCYMLHNPEYQLSNEQNSLADNQASLYYDIQQAFIFLEEQVTSGKIRYYGISSNGFPLAPEHPGAISLPEILKIAKNISPEHHFRMIEFPFNLIENNASEQNFFDGKSLIELAKSEGIVTVGNRPLNANIENNTIRLANNNIHIDGEEIEKGKKIADEIFSTIETEIVKVNWKNKIADTPSLAFLHGNWFNISHIQGIVHIFSQQLNPFIHQLYAGKVPDNLNRQIEVFRLICEKSALNQMNQIASAIKKQLEERGVVQSTDSRPLQEILCEKYLEAGIDHVLIGMRRTDYVRNFESFLHPG